MGALLTELVVFGFVSLLWFYFVFQAYRSYDSLSKLNPTKVSAGDELPKVIVFVPARNEEEVIVDCLKSVLEQKDSVSRVIVIDDRSTDATPELLSQLDQDYEKLEILTGSEPELGNCGKPSALFNAYSQSAPTEDWLMFLDADVVLSPGSISSMLSWATAHDAQLLSGFPKLLLQSPIEKIVMPSVAALIGRKYPAKEVMDAQSALAFANGQLILVKRESYEAVGGHRPVLTEILEDVRLAETLKASGVRIGLVNLELLAKTRMYSTWRELQEGWSKNLYLLMKGGLLTNLIWAVLSILIGCSGIILFFCLSFPLNIIGFSTVTSAQMLIRWKLGFPVFWSMFSSISSCCSAYLLLKSTFLHTFGATIAWKGRNYN